MGNFNFGKEGEDFLGGLSLDPKEGLDPTNLGGLRTAPYWGLLGGPYEEDGGLYEVVGAGTP